MPGVTEQPFNPESLTAESRRRMIAFGVIGLAFLVRLVQLSSAMVSPLTYQPGPDEDYYRRFGEAVAAGQGGQDSPEFTFMDPAYGYILGAIFKLVGVNLFLVYLLQILLDTATAYGVLTLGRLLGRQRAGLIGAVIYGLTSTAVMFCTTLLKEVWVTAYLTWWVIGALLLLRAGRKWAWLMFGFYCGLGVGLRSTLVVLGLPALLLPFWQVWQGGSWRKESGYKTDTSGAATVDCRDPKSWLSSVVIVACGMVIGLLPWVLRNHHNDGSLSPLPHNSGIILHQVYNDQNPRAEIWIPSFVGYLHPSEIWRGYADEAGRRAGHALAPPEIDRYWHDEALTFIEQHPAEVVRDVLRKGLVGWLSDSELANNRSDIEERMFSPVLALLPSPAAWLLGLGLAGLLWLALEDRRWVVIAAPIALAWLTMAVFFAESRFRFHAAPVLALCSGVWIDQLTRHRREGGNVRAIVFVTVAAVVATASIVLGLSNPAPPVRWDRIAWGYINMGRIREARSLAERVSKEQPENGAILEALGFTAAVSKQYDAAAQALERAVELRPRSHVAHYNLARVYLALGDRKRAAEEAGIAANLYSSPDYQALVNRIASGS
jgi:4-amino-4-deoxy-L-arabinose transferase-like glycosyltransferase